MKPSIEVVCAVLHRGKRFLASCRPESSPYAGFWELPGGKIEQGEAPEKALARELSEELGIGGLHEPRLWKTVTHDYPDRFVTLHVFVTDVFSGEPVPVEGQVLRWVTPEEGQALCFLEADTTLVSEISSVI